MALGDGTHAPVKADIRKAINKEAATPSVRLQERIDN